MRFRGVTSRFSVRLRGVTSRFRLPTVRRPHVGWDPPEATDVPQTVVPIWLQAVALPLAIVGFVALALAAGSVLPIVLVASTVGMVLNPLAKLLERWLPRGLSILFAYVLVAACVAGIVIVLANPISDQLNHFEQRIPHLIKSANRDLLDIQRWLNARGLHVHFAGQGQTALQGLQHRLLKSSGTIVSFSRDLLSKLLTLSVEAVLVLVLSVYMLIYGRQIAELARHVMPRSNGTPEDDFPTLVQHAVAGYVRGQLLFTLIMGLSATVALWLIGVTGVFPLGEKYALFFGAFYGLMEFIPYFGPVAGAIPPILVALFTNPISALWVLLMFVGLQQLEGHIVAPQIFRISLRINPILVILALLVGEQLYGIVGALIALPLATVTRQIVLYLRSHLVLEQPA
jgi:predicted PurR-regulated permease PerM